ncbi:hypothetical protein PIB30_067052 [Stylosanthes scabra]|uniref:Uncharacterized protein n=1 Tax=Stylosanthes scabra TaxID=79078 RepID=A0ABU6ULG1_9FABA|nr:hypothetical protein [Stylosanthes scabra]
MEQIQDYFDDDQDQDQDFEDHQKLLGYVNAEIRNPKNDTGNVNDSEIMTLVGVSSDAIEVYNKHSLPVGTVTGDIPKALYPLIKSGQISIEGISPARTNMNLRFEITIQIVIYTPVYSSRFLTDYISETKVQLITPNDAEFTLSAPVKETAALKRFKEVDAIFRRLGEELSAKERVPEALEPPESIVRTKLLQHQKEGLWWLVTREESEEVPPFWEETTEGGKEQFLNWLTKESTCVKPEPLKGGILADEMGLGKTLTLLSLIALDKGKGDGDSGESNATLVVCPVSVFSTWISQLEEHIVPGSLSYYKYYGGDRTKKAEDLMNFDLVLTSYSTMASEEPDVESPVKKVVWRRIILDEAHTIKDPAAGKSKMVTKLNARRRWAVTGTPIQNGSVDLFSLMVFLRFEPFNTRVHWRRFLQRPINQRLDSGLQRLKVLMAAISLRRTKDEGLLGLPPKTIETHYVELNAEERQLYNEAKEKATLLLTSFEYDRFKFHDVLSKLLRLRQICTDSALCTEELPTAFKDVSNKPHLLQKFVEKLQEENFECPICLFPKEDLVITKCAHVFCRACLLKALENQPGLCSYCRGSLGKSDLFSPIDLAPAAQFTRLSSKGRALIKFLQESREEKPAAKSVVFTQFRKLLVLLETPLKAAGFKTLRLDGSMSADQRTKVINEFQGSESDGATVLLATLRASGAGINLTAASTVYFMEPWWSPAVEGQAMDRVHRIGQKEAVKIVRLVAKNSIEERILMMLKEKKQVIAMDPSKERITDSGGMTYDNLKFLLFAPY